MLWQSLLGEGASLPVKRVCAHVYDYANHNGMHLKKQVFVSLTIISYLTLSNDLCTGKGYKITQLNALRNTYKTT